MITKAVNLRKEPYDVYIGRAGKGKDGFFGNPIVLGKRCDYCYQIHEEPGSTLDCYREYFLMKVENNKEFRNRVLGLKGKRLGCFCKPKPCHGDIIATWVDLVSEQDKYRVVFDMLNELNCEFYSLEGCAAGGPLHIVLDDSNVGDSSLDFCEKELDKNNIIAIKSIGKAIIAILRTLTEEQRMIWWKKRYLDIYDA